MSSYALTTNHEQNTSQSLGDLAKGNIQAGQDVNQTIYGLYGEELDGFLNVTSEIANNAMNKTNSSLSQSLSHIANAYQSAYQESSGILQQLKPVLMVGAVVLAAFIVPKLWRKM